MWQPDDQSAFRNLPAIVLEGHVNEISRYKNNQLLSLIIFPHVLHEEVLCFTYIMPQYAISRFNPLRTNHDYNRVRLYLLSL